MSSSCCSGCQVTLPSHDVCQVVVLLAMIYDLYGSLMHQVSTSFDLAEIIKVGYVFLLVRLS